MWVGEKWALRALWAVLKNLLLQEIKILLDWFLKEWRILFWWLNCFLFCFPIGVLNVRSDSFFFICCHHYFVSHFSFPFVTFCHLSLLTILFYVFDEVYYVNISVTLCLLSSPPDFTMCTKRNKQTKNTFLLVNFLGLTNEWFQHFLVAYFFFKKKDVPCIINCLRTL